MTDTITLRADDLSSKWGFGDGDILNDFELWELFSKVDDHAVLIRLVREHLLPLLPDWLQVYEIGTCHNPIRAARQIDHRFCEDSYVTVEITRKMVLNMAEKMLIEAEL